MKKYENYKIHWHKFIPFVIAEVKNSEWEGIKSLIKEGTLSGIYNSTGNWYVLEGLDYFWFKKEWWTNRDKNILFSDSMWLRFNEKSDKEKYAMLIDQAKEDIDIIWDKFWNN